MNLTGGPARPDNPGDSLYDRVGGASVFKRLVDNFYERVAADPVLRPLFPDDLEPGKRYQFLFLSQYFGGPPDYLAERGHPRLRMRHMPFAIDRRVKDRWLEHMLAAIDSVGIAEPDRSEMRQYFERAAEFMINRFEDGSSG